MAALPLERTYTTPSELSSVFFSSVASEMVDALSSSTAGPIKAIDQGLHVVIGSVLRHADPKAIAVMQGQSGAPQAVIDAYVLGQINFAEKLSACAASSRIEEPVLEMLRGRKYSRYLQVLMEGERTNTEFARLFNYAEETVSRTIRQLRKEGITDFRKYGTSVYNFLTPMARRILEMEKAQRDQVLGHEHGPALEVQDLLSKFTRGLPEHQQKSMTFGPSVKIAA